jgi:hypothetical protein
MADTKFIQSKVRQLGISWYKMGNDLGLPLRTIYRWKNGKGINPLYEKKVMAYLNQKEKEKELL